MANAKLSTAKTFRDVKSEVLRRIQAKIWKPGALIPGEIELADEFGCARATVNRALRELADEGLIDRKRKAGTRIAAMPLRQARLEIPLIRAEIEAAGAAYRYALVSRAEIQAPAWLKSQIALPASSQVLHLQCMHYADNAPFQFEDRWINIAAVSQITKADFSSISPNEWLIRTMPFSTAEFSFSSVMAGAEAARFLGVAEATPVLLSERTTWLGEKPITFARMFFRPGYRLTTRI